MSAVVIIGVPAQWLPQDLKHLQDMCEQTSTVFKLVMLYLPNFSDLLITSLLFMTDRTVICSYHNWLVRECMKSENIRASQKHKQI